MLQETNKVLWAVDPFAKEKKLQFAAFKALAKLTEKTGAKIEPVAVLSPDQLRLPEKAFERDAKHFELKAETELKSWVKKLNHPRLTSPTLLVRDIYSTNISVDVLLRYARQTDASLIAAGTHNKKGLKRFFLGSFAETLMLTSEIPLLLVNPRCPVKRTMSRILFPTDFSPTSKRAFEKLVPYAKSLNAKVTLYFKFEYLLPETAELVRMSPSYRNYFESDMKLKKELAGEWAEQAKELGVKVDVVIDEKGIFVPEGILREAKRSKADLIAMASNSGGVSAALVGSVARDVLRASTLPVWVMHPSVKAVAGRRSELVRARKVRFG